MARDLNKWMGIGRLGQNPEIANLPSGGVVANLSIACSNDYKDKKTGQMVEQTEWVRIVMFNRLAEIVNEYVRKGSKVYIEGQLRTRSWEQDGVKRYSTEIVAAEMQMLDSRQGGAQAGGQGQAPQQQNYNQQAPQGRPQAQQAQQPYQQQQAAQQSYHQQAQQATQGGFNDGLDLDIPF